MTRYFLAQDHEHRWWLVDANHRDDWQRSLDEGGHYQWDGPDYAEEVDLAALTFANPEVA